MARYDAGSRMHIDATVQTWRDVSLIGVRVPPCDNVPVAQ